jgi:hypothetical protein
MTETTTSISKYGIPTLTGIDNYYEWKSATQDAILAMGALEVITLDKKKKPKALASEGVRSTRTEVATRTSAEVSLYHNTSNLSGNTNPGWTRIRGSWECSG